MAVESRLSEDSLLLVKELCLHLLEPQLVLLETHLCVVQLELVHQLFICEGRHLGLDIRPQLGLDGHEEEVVELEEYVP